MKYIVKWNLPGGPMYLRGFCPRDGVSLWTIHKHCSTQYNSLDIAVRTGIRINDREGINIEDLETEEI